MILCLKMRDDSRRTTSAAVWQTWVTRGFRASCHSLRESLMSLVCRSEYLASINAILLDRATDVSTAVFAPWPELGAICFDVRWS